MRVDIILNILGEDRGKGRSARQMTSKIVVLILRWEIFLLSSHFAGDIFAELAFGWNRAIKLLGFPAGVTSWRGIETTAHLGSDARLSHLSRCAVSSSSSQPLQISVAACFPRFGEGELCQSDAHKSDR